MAWATAETFDVLGTTRASNGTLLVQIGDAAHGRVYDNDVPLYQQSGFASRPASPDDKGACEVFVVGVDSERYIVGSRDIRRNEVYGNLEPGDTAVFATSGQARLLMKADGSATLYTTDDNTPNGQSVFLSVASDGVKMGGPWGALTIDASGVQLATKQGAWLLLGSDGNATLGGGQVGVAGGAVALGIGASKPVALLINGTAVSTSVFAA